jgi:excisionase family DNA binding protein
MPTVPRNRAERRRPVRPVEPAPGPSVLTVNETAWVLRCHPNSVWNLIGSGRLKSFTLGRKRLIAREAVDDLIAAGGTSEAS